MSKINCTFTEMVPVHKLQKNPKNPNQHPDKQIERLAKIIDYQGMRSPIVVSKRSGFITKGHGRLLALESLGWEEVPVDYQDYEDEAQEYADMVSDNAIAEWSKQDFKQINVDFVDLGPDFELEMLGFEKFKLDVGDDIQEEGGSITMEEITPNNYQLIVVSKDEEKISELFNELSSRGLKCKLM